MSSITPISVLAGIATVRPDLPEGTSNPGGSAQPAEVQLPAPAAKQTAAEQQRRVKAAAEQIESYLRHVNTNLEFRVDDAAGKVVVTVREQATGELIRQIPSEEALAIAAQLDEYRISGLVDKKT